MNKFLVCIFYFSLFLPFNRVFAQNNLYRLDAYSNAHVPINDYQGATVMAAYKVTLSGSGAGSGQLNLSNWRLAVRLKGVVNPKQGAQDKPFPPGKIALRPNKTSGSLVPGPVPTVAQIGMTPKASLALNQAVYLVPQSNAAIVNTTPNNSYYSVMFEFDFIVEGGAYLANVYQNYTNYNVPLEFILYNEQNVVLSRVTPTNYVIQVNPLGGNPPIPNQLSIKLNGQALNGALEFQTLNDYAQGVSVTYPASLTIASNTDYDILVKSLQQNFSTANNQSSIPLNSVQLRLLANAGHTATVTPRWLSTQDQVLATGATTNNANKTFDIIYNTKANDGLLIQSPAGVYKTILQYQIIPK